MELCVSSCFFWHFDYLLASRLVQEAIEKSEAKRKKKRKGFSTYPTTQARLIISQRALLTQRTKFWFHNALKSRLEDIGGK